MKDNLFMFHQSILENISNNNPNLAVVNLSCCDVEDPDMDRICAALTDNTQVHSLLVNWNKLTDKGAYRIAELMRTNHHLERVELAGNPAITQECVQQLQLEFEARFMNKPGLRRLALNPYHGVRFIDEVIDLKPEDFIANFYNIKRPVVVRGAIKDSIAAKLWTPEYFSNVLGEKEAPLSLWSPSDYLNNQFYHLKKVKFSIKQIMALFSDDATTNSLSGRLYLQNHPLDEFSDIRGHVAPPEFCDLINLNSFVPHVWCGQNDTLTQLHFDELDNVFLQVYGQKSVTLFPPTDTRFLFQYKPDKHIGLRNVHRSRIPGTDLLDDYATIHRQATPYHAHMRETDALYIPKRWWHDVRGLSGPSISVNYWFHTNENKLTEVECLFSREWMSYSILEKKSIIYQVSALLLQRNCPNYVFERMPFTLIQVAIRFNMIDVVEQLLSHPSTELLHTPFYCSPILLAIVFEHHEILALLLRNGMIRASINEECPGYGCTPLTLATEIGHSESINELRKCGAVM